jgi:hypothetical protein
MSKEDLLLEAKSFFTKTLIHIYSLESTASQKTCDQKLNNWVLEKPSFTKSLMHTYLGKPIFTKKDVTHNLTHT